MEIIPAINCADARSFRSRIEEAKKFVPQDGWIHIDVSDKETTGMELFFDSGLVKLYSTYFRFEIHAMIAKERLSAPQWFLGSKTRLLVDWRSLGDKLFDSAQGNKTQIGAVINFDEDISQITLPEKISYVEVLSVPAGPSGGTFQNQALQAVAFLKEKHPNVTISVDGGVNEEIAKRVKQAGANVLISGSYIWGSSDPAQAYAALKRL